MEIMTAQQIKQLRDTKGWSTNELAYHVGVSDDAVRKWERGERTPRGAAMKALLRLAGKNGNGKHRQN
jgi:DNA-binding transcriptional regulator YiaG